MGRTTGRRIGAIVFTFFAFILVGLFCQFIEWKPAGSLEAEKAGDSPLWHTPEPAPIPLGNQLRAALINWDEPSLSERGVDVLKANPHRIGDFPPSLPAGQQEIYDKLQRGEYGK